MMRWMAAVLLLAGVASGQTLSLESQVSAVGPFDGVADFAGPSGAQAPEVVAVTDLAPLADDPARWVGANSVPVRVAFTALPGGYSRVNGPMDLGVRTRVGASVTVTFTVLADGVEFVQTTTRRVMLEPWTVGTPVVVDVPQIVIGGGELTAVSVEVSAMAGLTLLGENRMDWPEPTVVTGGVAIGLGVGVEV